MGSEKAASLVCACGPCSRKPSITVERCKSQLQESIADKGNAIMLNRRHISLALLSATVAPTLAFAQAYPARPVKLIVPYAAGGGTDAIARIVAQVMGEKLGQTVVVENVATGAGNVATAQAAAAPADGYTVLMANQGPIAVNPHMMKGLKVDTLKAFSSVTQIASAPLVVVVPESSAIKTFGDLVDAARKNPGKLTYGSAGNGSASHVATLLLNYVAKIDTVHVPYRGAGPAISDLLGSQTQFMVTTIPSVAGLIDTGRMRALGVTTKQRTTLLKDVPAIAELGFPNYEASAWYGLVVPAGTPASVIDKLRQAANAALESDLVRARLTSDGAAPVGGTSEAFAAFMRDEHARWKEIVSASNLQIE
jgi:tripartite-type tricarboxylate transporter receptor subunit TctC